MKKITSVRIVRGLAITLSAEGPGLLVTASKYFPSQILMAIDKLAVVRQNIACLKAFQKKICRRFLLSTDIGKTAQLSLRMYVGNTTI
jgi:hypothetical protein